MGIIPIISNKPIAIYGLGTETERLISLLGEEHNIVGLLDGYKENGEQFDYPIISLQQAIDAGVDTIIVVARPGSCKVIAKRIREACIAAGITVYDVRGNDLLAEREAKLNFQGINVYTKSELMTAIDSADIVSFDLFDTLITRKLFFYTDIFEIMGLSQIRLSAEKELSAKGAPTLTEIYQNVVEAKSNINQSPEELAAQEWRIDSSSMVSREDVDQILDYAKKAGKKLVLTSDSYYSRAQIESILTRYNLNCFDQFFISCEEGIAKTTGLFGKLANYAHGKTVLHIGDDEWADVEKAKEFGINSFRIYSGKDLFDFLGGMGIEPNVKTVVDRVKLGMFIARQFSSPFQFEDGCKDAQLSRAEDIGYQICGPMIIDFMMWMLEKSKEENLANILLCARDGYLVKKIYDMLTKDDKAKYFLTSRISAIRAGVTNDEDIRYVNSMKFFGDDKECLKVRFGVADENTILQASKQKRENYMTYISSLNLTAGKLGVFDFVAKGTTQFFLQKIMPQELLGLYFLQLEPEFMADKNLKIESFYTEKERDTSAIFDNYYILEAILTSPMPSIDEFDEEGKPVYAPETRSQQNLNCISKMQHGILEYVSDCLSLIPMNAMEINKQLDEAFLSLIQKMEISVSDFKSLVVEDPFFGRMTNVTEVL